MWSQESGELHWFAVLRLFGTLMSLMRCRQSHFFPPPDIVWLANPPGVTLWPLFVDRAGKFSQANREGECARALVPSTP